MSELALKNDCDRTGDPAIAIHENEVNDYSGKTERAHPVLEASVVQTAPGPEPTNLTLYHSEKITLIGLRHHAPSVGVVILKPEYFAFMWWQGQTDVRINGEAARFTRLYTQGQQDGFHAVGGKRTTMGVAVRRKDLIETVAAVRGVGPEEVLLNKAVLQLSPSWAQRFRSCINLNLRRALDKGIAAAGQDEALFGLLLEVWVHSLRERQCDRMHCPPEEIVRKAEERFFAAGEQPVSLADLCAAARVSQSSLYRAFHHVCDQPPLAYFHKRRLNNARRSLVQSPARRGAVKKIALGAGLTELGRFAGEYRRLFGESPSMTLNRNTAQ